MQSSSQPSSLFPTSIQDISSINAICIGSGRFLRSVLVPALLHCHLKPIILQTRGRSFMDYCRVTDGSNNHGNNQNGFLLSYEVDTVQFDGNIRTDSISCYGAGTLGTTKGKDDVLKKLIPNMKNISMIGIGVTEAGLSSVSSKAVQDFCDLLYTCYKYMIVEKTLSCENPNGKICVVCTDNVPNSGDLLKGYMIEIAKEKSHLFVDNNGKDDKTFESPSKKCRVEQQNMGSIITFEEFLTQRVTFHNTMVDRITSERDGSNGMVPRAEPVPAKAIVIEDLNGDLPRSFTLDDTQKQFGVVVRTKKGQLSGDIALKLRVANGTHTAAAHLMALSKILMTDKLSSQSDEAALIMAYLDALFKNQILPAAEKLYGMEETKAVYEDWRGRLIHAHFGLSTFFITQNGAAKGGIRLGPTIRSLFDQQKSVNCSTAFALACILRFLTPITKTQSKEGIYTGWLDGFHRNDMKETSTDKDTVTYADGLSYNLKQGWYEFRCTCMVKTSDTDGTIPLPELLGSHLKIEQPSFYEDAIRSYLVKSDGGDLADVANNSVMKNKFDELVKSVSTLYARMVAGDGLLTILKEMSESQGMSEGGSFDCDCSMLVDALSDDVKRPLHYRPSPIGDKSNLMQAKIGRDEESIRKVVFSEVASVLAIDLHTHLLPPSHGTLCLWGIDELLTYHYLVAEYFMVATPKISPQAFYAQSKQKQADLIWKALFLERSPISEACRGVITTLSALGLKKEIEARDLDAIRLFYKSYRNDGIEGAERYCNLVYKISGIKYTIMTNIPFDPTEAQHWRPRPKEYSSHFRSALRVDPLLSGDRKVIEMALAVSGYEKTIQGAKQYLNDWCDIMKPEYMMASTPHDFVLDDRGPLSNNNIRKTGVNEEAMAIPGAFVDVASRNNQCNQECNGEEDELASVINESSDFLSDVLMAVCEERDLPVALKIGAHRKVNPILETAGDGVVAFADSGVLARLCTRFPKVRFLATFLSRNNQHEACVLATKFRNLHLYGCWWFCNNPSIIEEITKMRVEMLGTAFTAQHSDARVLDQLIYKWAHSRTVIADVLSRDMIKLIQSGWVPTRGELRRDVKRLFGGSYEDFMSKSFADNNDK